MSPRVKEFYLDWVHGPKLFGHPYDEQRFYRFVKACIRYSRVRLSGEWLRPFLEKDLAGRNEYTVREAIHRFDILLDFNRTSF